MVPPIATTRYRSFGSLNGGYMYCQFCGLLLIHARDSHRGRCRFCATSSTECSCVDFKQGGTCDHVERRKEMGA